MRFRPKKLCMYVLVICSFVCFCLVLYTGNESNDSNKYVVLNDVQQAKHVVLRTWTDRPALKPEVPFKNASSENTHVDHVVTNCKNITCPLHLIKDNTWQLVDNKTDVIVFSAYFMGGSGDVDIIAARNRFQKLGDLRCQFWWQNDTSGGFTMVESLMRNKDNTEHHGLR